MKQFSPRLPALSALISLLLLAGCATSLKPLHQPDAEIACVGDAQACYQQGVSRFEAYRDRRIAEIDAKSDGYRLPGAPLAKFVNRRSEYVVLLIHGLNDSAFYMHDLAEIFAYHGINALTVLLPGHGTVTENTLEVTAEDWRREVDEVRRIAGLLGDKLILAGFSLGSTLALDSMLQGNEVHGLFVFSPALQLQKKAIGPLACLPFLRSRFVTTDLARNPIKYTRRSGNGVCQLYRIMKANLKRGRAMAAGASEGWESYVRMGNTVSVPSFVALTYGDARITPQSVLAFTSGIKAPARLVVYGAPDGLNDKLANGAEVVKINPALLPHSFLILGNNPYNEQVNPFYDDFSKQLSDFIQTHFD